MKSKEDLEPCLNVSLDAYTSAKAELTSAQQMILEYEEHARSVNAAWHKGMADFKATMTAATQEGPRPYMDNYVKAASSVVESTAKVVSCSGQDTLFHTQSKKFVPVLRAKLYTDTIEVVVEIQFHGFSGVWKQSRCNFEHLPLSFCAGQPVDGSAVELPAAEDTGGVQRRQEPGVHGCAE